jgi:hypothetical protein
MAFCIKAFNQPMEATMFQKISILTVLALVSSAAQAATYSCEESAIVDGSKKTLIVTENVSDKSVQVVFVGSSNTCNVLSGDLVTEGDSIFMNTSYSLKDASGNPAKLSISEKTQCGRAGCNTLNSMIHGKLELNLDKPVYFNCHVLAVD